MTLLSSDWLWYSKEGHSTTFICISFVEFIMAYFNTYDYSNVVTTNQRSITLWKVYVNLIHKLRWISQHSRTHHKHTENEQWMVWTTVRPSVEASLNPAKNCPTLFAKMGYKSYLVVASFPVVTFWEGTLWRTYKQYNLTKQGLQHDVTTLSSFLSVSWGLTTGNIRFLVRLNNR